MGKRQIRKGINDKNSGEGGRVRVIRFPTFCSREIVCPICEGSGCKICNKTGYYEITQEVWANVQHPHIIQYIHDNFSTVSKEYNKLYGSKLKLSTNGIYKINKVKWEILEIDSLSGTMWVCICQEHNEVKHFYGEKEMKKWLVSGK
tara:strand:+ start:834 stop:1274 length:441 start_codon:yes stop_codon:yes gene_type:complete